MEDTTTTVYKAILGFHSFIHLVVFEKSKILVNN